jgi:hypothetical protein
MPRLTDCGHRKLIAKSCGKCGELKSADQYYLEPRSGTDKLYRSSWCVPCRYLSVKNLVRKSNEASLEKATHHWELWSDSEVKDVWRLTNLGLSTREVAERLGRTESAILVCKSKSRVYDSPGVLLRYYDASSNMVFTVGKPYYVDVKGHAGRLNSAAAHLAELHKQLIFFIEVDEGGEYMGIHGIDSLKENDDRESDKTVPKEETPQDD